MASSDSERDDDAAGEDDGWLEWPDADSEPDGAVAAEVDDDERPPRIDVAERVAAAIDADERARAEADGESDEVDDDLPSWMRRARPIAAEEALEGVIAAGVEAGDDATGELLPATTAVSAARIDNVPAAIGALSMRIDSLIAATTTYRSVLSDRLAEYAELVTRLHRTHASDLDEFRKANERTVGEIRKTLTANEKSQREVAAHAESLVRDVDSLTEHAKTSAADARELLEATDKLGRFVTEALDQFAERVLIEVKGISESVTPVVSSLRNEISLVRESLDQLNERSSLAPLREAIDEVRSDMSGLRRAVIEWPDLELARSEIVAMRADLTNLLEASGLGGDEEQGLLERTATDISRVADLVRRLPTRDELVEVTAPPDDDPLAPVVARLDELAERVDADPAAALRDEVAHLRGALDRIEGALGADDETTSAIASLTGELAEVRAAVEAVAAQPAPTLDVSAVAAEVAGLLGEPQASVDVDALAARIADAIEVPVAAAPDASAAVGDELAELRAQVAELARTVGALPTDGAGAGVSDAALEKLAKEMAALRRRIKVRAPD